MVPKKCQYNYQMFHLLSFVQYLKYGMCHIHYSEPILTFFFHLLQIAFVLGLLVTFLVGTESSLPSTPHFGPAGFLPAAVLPISPKFVRIVPQSVPPHAYSVNIVTRALSPPPPYLLPPYIIPPTQPLIPAPTLNFWRR